MPGLSMVSVCCCCPRRRRSPAPASSGTWISPGVPRRSSATTGRVDARPHPFAVGVTSFLSDVDRRTGRVADAALRLPGSPGVLLPTSAGGLAAVAVRGVAPDVRPRTCPRRQPGAGGRVPAGYDTPNGSRDTPEGVSSVRGAIGREQHRAMERPRSEAGSRRSRPLGGAVGLTAPRRRGGPPPAARASRARRPCSASATPSTTSISAECRGTSWNTVNPNASAGHPVDDVQRRHRRGQPRHPVGPLVGEDPAGAGEDQPVRRPRVSTVHAAALNSWSAHLDQRPRARTAPRR